MGCHFLLQGIFPTQGLSPALLHCSRILYCQSHPEREMGQLLGQAEEGLATHSVRPARCSAGAVRERAVLTERMGAEVPTRVSSYNIPEGQSRATDTCRR